MEVIAVSDDIRNDYQAWKQREISGLRLRLAHDLQSVYLKEVMSEIHPSILQIALEQFTRVAVQRKHDQRINITKILEVLKGE